MCFNVSVHYVDEIWVPLPSRAVEDPLDELSEAGAGPEEEEATTAEVAVGGGEARKGAVGPKSSHVLVFECVRAGKFLTGPKPGAPPPPWAPTPTPAAPAAAAAAAAAPVAVAAETWQVLQQLADMSGTMGQQVSMPAEQKQRGGSKDVEASSPPPYSDILRLLADMNVKLAQQLQQQQQQLSELQQQQQQQQGSKEAQQQPGAEGDA